MALYEYRCRECGKAFERLRRWQDADLPTTCPACDSDAVERVISAFATGGCAPAASGGFS